MLDTNIDRQEILDSIGENTSITRTCFRKNISTGEIRAIYVAPKTWVNMVPCQAHGFEDMAEMVQCCPITKAIDPKMNVVTQSQTTQMLMIYTAYIIHLWQNGREMERVYF